MAASLGTPAPYSPPSPPDTSSSATMSPVYPSRPIRPLPRRSLRARLSPEVADQITYPPAPPTNTPLFSIPFDADDDCAHMCKEGLRYYGQAVDSDESDENIIRRFEEYTQQHEEDFKPVGATNSNKEPVAVSVTSSNDSGDGYDSFENTNNKKKRKIPLSGNQAFLTNSLSQELAKMEISGTRDATATDGAVEDVSHYYAGSAAPVASSGTGISGAGRGRYGRAGRRDVNGRSPLGLATGNNPYSWQNNRLGNSRRDPTAGSSLGAKDHGIISAAIAEAATQPKTAAKGKENVSLLDQQSSKKRTPAETQFTFTCEPDSKNMMWPGAHGGAVEPIANGSTGQHTANQASLHASQKGFSNQATQTSPTMSGPNGSNNTEQPRKPRRSAAKRYAIAARDRRIQQEINNCHNPPKEEDIWICEFCEYESIFGVPPEALVRQYEIKDRQERKRLEEKRRLLEKAKMKGRKNKKPGKNASKHQAASNQLHQPAQQSYSPNEADHYGGELQDGQDEDCYCDSYDPPTTPVMPDVSSRHVQASDHNFHHHHHGGGTEAAGHGNKVSSRHA